MSAPGENMFCSCRLKAATGQKPYFPPLCAATVSIKIYLNIQASRIAEQYQTLTRAIDVVSFRHNIILFKYNYIDIVTIHFFTDKR